MLPACLFTLAYFLPPSPRPPSPPGKGEIKGYFMQGASPLASPGLYPGGTGSTKGFCLSTGAVPVAKERGDRGRGTSAFEMVLSPGAGRASAAQGSATPPRTTAAGQTSAAGGQAPIAFSTAAGTASAAGGGAPPAPPLPSFPFPQQSPHKENHAVDERREENRQNNMRENTEPEKADRRNRTRRESRGKHAE